MKKTIDILFKIDKFLDNWFAQGILFIVFVVGLQLRNSLFSIWLAIGLFGYAYLMYRNYQTIPGYHQQMKDDFKEHGMFPFVKGFNYCVICGPLSFLLAYVLQKDEDESEPKK